MELQSTKFMTKEEKQKVITNFRQFLASNLMESKFTKALYSHLSTNCGFIAHYDKFGFYEARFTDLEDTVETFKEIIRSANHCSADYQDINTQLAIIVDEYGTDVLKVLAKSQRSA